MKSLSIVPYCTAHQLQATATNKFFQGYVGAVSSAVGIAVRLQLYLCAITNLVNIMNNYSLLNHQSPYDRYC